MNDAARWAVVERDGETHVKPLDDIMVHGGSDCWCKPRLEDGVWVHSSADRREDEEQKR